MNTVSNGPYCTVDWCEVERPHTMHEAVVGQWHGRDATNPAKARTLQAVKFASTPYYLGLKPAVHLGLTVIDPTSTTLPQLSVFLQREDWWEVAEVIDAVAARVE